MALVVTPNVGVMERLSVMEIQASVNVLLATLVLAAGKVSALLSVNRYLLIYMHYILQNVMKAFLAKTAFLG